MYAQAKTSTRVSTHVTHLLCEFLLLRRFRHLPVIHIPPPSPHFRPYTRPTELRTTIPKSPSVHHQIPKNTLRQREQDLISRSDIRHLPPRLCRFDTGEVGLFEAEVRYRWEGLAAWTWADDV